MKCGFVLIVLTLESQYIAGLNEQRTVQQDEPIEAKHAAVKHLDFLQMWFCRFSQDGFDWFINVPQLSMTNNRLLLKVKTHTNIIPLNLYLWSRRRASVLFINLFLKCLYWDFSGFFLFSWLNYPLYSRSEGSVCPAHIKQKHAYNLLGAKSKNNTDLELVYFTLCGVFWALKLICFNHIK